MDVQTDRSVEGKSQIRVIFLEIIGGRRYHNKRRFFWRFRVIFFEGDEVTFWKKKANGDLEETGSSVPAPSETTSSISAGSAVLGEAAAKPTILGGEATAPRNTSSEKSNDRTETGDRYEKFRSALGVGTVIHGKLSFDTPVRIDGKLSGEVFSSKAVVVGAQGSIDATIDVASIVIMGAVRGTVRARERVELLAGGRIDGDVFAPAISIGDGAIFNGKCSMLTSEKAIAASTKREKSEEPRAREEARKDRTETRIEEAPAADRSAPLH